MTTTWTNDQLASVHRRTIAPSLTLTIVVSIHVLVFFWWRADSWHLARVTSGRSVDIVFVAPPKPAAAIPAVRKRPPARSPAPIRVLPAPAEAITIVPATPLPFAGTEGVAGRAKAGVGRVYRELLTEDRSQRAPIANETPFARAIAAAFIPRSTTIEEVVMADGRRMSKVSGPRGTYCVVMESSNSAARDPFKYGGSQMKTMSCPQ
jgi:hypothetical protein